MFGIWVHGIRNAFGRVFAYVLAPDSHVFARTFGQACPLETRRKDTTPFAFFEILRTMKNVFVEDIAWIVVSFCLCLKWQESLARFLHPAIGYGVLHPVVAFKNRSG